MSEHEFPLNRFLFSPSAPSNPPEIRTIEEKMLGAIRENWLTPTLSRRLAQVTREAYTQVLEETFGTLDLLTHISTGNYQAVSALLELGGVPIEEGANLLTATHYIAMKHLEPDINTDQELRMKVTLEEIAVSDSAKQHAFAIEKKRFLRTTDNIALLSLRRVRLMQLITKHHEITAK